MDLFTYLWLITLAILSSRFGSTLSSVVYTWQALPILQRHARRLKSLRYLGHLEEFTLPPLTLLLPVHHEKQEIVKILRRCMEMNYPRIDYLVLNNAEDQDSFEALRENFGLKPVPRFPVAELSARAVKGVYQSEDVPNLWVIDKEPGSISDALNAGLNFCQTPLVAVISPHFQPEKDALLQISRPFLENSQTWASTGRIRPRGSSDEKEQPALPQSIWAKQYLLLNQRRELVQAIHEDRSGHFNWLRTELSLFRRASLVEAGGFPSSGKNFMIDTAIRLRRLARLQGDKMTLSFVPDTLGWVDIPDQAKEVRELLVTEQQMRKDIHHHEPSARIRFKLLWQGFGEHLLTILTCLSALLILLWNPVWLSVWLTALLSFGVVWQRVLLLGELTSHRYSKKNLKRLQIQVWALSLFWSPLLAWWQIQGWMKKLEEPKSEVKTPAHTSPLKQTARLSLDEWPEL